METTKKSCWKEKFSSILIVFNKKWEKKKTKNVGKFHFHGGKSEKLYKSIANEWLKYFSIYDEGKFLRDQKIHVFLFNFDCVRNNENSVIIIPAIKIILFIDVH